MKKIEMIKAVGEAVVSLGVGAIVANLVKITTPASAKLITKICIGVGGLVLSSMASDAATDYVEDKFNDAVEGLKKQIKENEI